MAQIKVVGSSVVVVSGVARKSIELAKKYRPGALMLKDENGDPVFAVGLCDEIGTVGQYGVTFGEATYGEGNLATATILTVGAPSADDIVEEFGNILISLNKVEQQITGVIPEIKAEIATIKEAVSFM